MARNIHHPHDKFMKSLMGDIEVAREYFGAFLPENLKEVLDLSQLVHAPNSFVSERLQETMADIVFKCPLKDRYRDQLLYLSLLFEHRSTPYKFVSIQIGGYLFDAYRDQVKDKVKPLIPVVPFLHYHGNDKWTPLDIRELFALVPPSIKDYIPFFKFLFENIQNYSDSQIQQLGSGLFTSALLTQKYAGRPELLIERFRQIFSILGSWKERNLFNTLIVYYIDLIEIEEEELNSLIEQLPKVMKTEFVSLADKLMEKGMVKGIEQGIEQERERKNWTATKNMLDKEFEVAVICDVLDVTPEFVEKVRKAMTD